MATVTGTSHFTSKRAAIRYYRDYGFDNVAVEVERKLAAGEINIGKPTLKPGQRFVLIDNGTRYATVDPD